MADAPRHAAGLTRARARRWASRAAPALKRALRGDLDGLDRYMAVMLPGVFAAFYVFDKHPHRPLFYVLALLPMALYLRRSVISEVAGLWVWRGGLALCGLWALSVVWSHPVSVESAFDALRTAGALAIFLTACSALAVRGRFPADGIAHAVVLTAGVCAVATFGLVAWPGVELLGDGRYSGLEGFGWADHRGNGGDIYGFAAVVALVLAVERRGRVAAVAFWTVFALCFVFVVLTESRAPVLGVMIAAATLAVAKSPRALGVMVPVVALAAGVVHLIGSVDLAHWVERGTAHRLDLWRDALDGIRNAPVLGAGAASTQLFTANGQTMNSPHNGFIGMFFYVGAAGGLLLIALCGHVAWRAIRTVRAGGSALPLVALVFGLTVVFFHTKSVVVLLNRDWLVFWLPVLLATAARLPTGHAASAAPVVSRHRAPSDPAEQR